MWVMFLFLVLFNIVLLWSHFRNVFRISYYQKKLELNNIEDGVKYIPFWKLTLE